MEEFRVKNIIIGKQFENCENYKKFMEIVKQKNSNVMVVEAGQKINIEKYLFFHVLWPDSQNKIAENVLNNNSLVCKMVYRNFSVLFTGDVEEIAERTILEKYKNMNILKASTLKVGHHGSKSSSTQEFLSKIKPQIALIGVGENNNFGHPNGNVLTRLQVLNSVVYRTDLNGEIIIEVNSKSKYKIKTKCD